MNDSSYVLSLLLKKYSIDINHKELEFQIKSHPTYPSLHSLTSVLNHFGIENLALELPTNKETLSNLPNYFIAHCVNIKGEHFVLAEKSENHINLTYNRNVKEKISCQKFLNSWTGVILAIEKNDETIPEKEKEDTRGRIVYYIAALGCLALFFLGLPDLFQSLHFLLSLSGIAISVLIIQHELGLQSKTLDKFCSGSNEKTSCNDVLFSKGATLFKTIKFSDIGIVYFSGISLSWLLLSLIPNADYSLIIAFTMAALPFTFFSIYYQFKVIKKWCPLCLSVLAVLWGQALSLFAFPGSFFHIPEDLHSTLVVFAGLAIMTALWHFIYPHFKLIQVHKNLKINHYRFKNNYTIFKSLISQKPQLDTSLEDSSEIILGNKRKKPLLRIILVTNPLCSHCKEAHHVILKILKTYREIVQIHIRFSVNLNSDTSLDAQIAWHLLNIYHDDGEEKALLALHEVYSDINPLEWIEKQSLNINNLYIDELTNETSWCIENNILFTPEILVNGRHFPNEYDRSDLYFFMDDIIEDEQEKTNCLVPDLEFTARNLN